MMPTSLDGYEESRRFMRNAQHTTGAQLMVVTIIMTILPNGNSCILNIEPMEQNLI
jgi:hypothetical protein